MYFLAGSPVAYSSGCKHFCHKSYVLFTTKCSRFTLLVASKWIFFFIVHDHKLNHVSYRTGPVEIELSSTQHCQKGKSTAFKSPQLQRRTRAVMQTPISEKPSRNPELYLNTNDKNKKCSIHTH